MLFHPAGNCFFLVIGQFYQCFHALLFQVIFCVTLISTLSGADSIHLFIHNLFIKWLLYARHYFGTRNKTVNINHTVSALMEFKVHWEEIYILQNLESMSDNARSIWKRGWKMIGNSMTGRFGIVRSLRGNC